MVVYLEKRKQCNLYAGTEKIVSGFDQLPSPKVRYLVVVRRAKLNFIYLLAEVS